MPRLTFLVLLSLPLMVGAQHKVWQGSWSANAGNSSTVFGGTWDATAGDDADTVSGSWTLMDASGAVLADGTWAARKDQNVWRGIWKARGRSGRVYSGTWRARSERSASSPFSDLFEAALSKAASGTWRMGTAYFGSWSIRAYPRQ